MLRMNSQRGFTLVEVLVVTAILGVLSTAIYNVYFAHNRTYMAQEQVVQIQQDMRIAMNYLVRDLRMAGLEDPFNRAGAGFVSATATGVNFTLDRMGGDSDPGGVDNDGDGVVNNSEEINWPDGALDDTGENLTYSLAGSELERIDGTGTRTLLENVRGLEFYYQLDGEPPLWTTAPDPERFEDIRAVRITIMGRTARPDPRVSAEQSFTPASGLPGEENAGLAWSCGAGYRCRLLTTTVKCRNMGL